MSAMDVAAVKPAPTRRRSHLLRAAWRQHQAATSVTVGIVLVLMTLMVWQTAALPICAGPYETGVNFCSNLTDGDLRRMQVLALVFAAAPFLLGLFLGITVFARDAELRTRLFALTQAVTRLRWWGSKTVVTLGPLVLSCAALGLTFSWALEHRASTWDVAVGSGKLDWPTLDQSWLIPAGWGLVAFAAASTAGLVVRSTVGGLVAAAMVVLVALVMSTGSRTDLVRNDFIDDPVADLFAAEPSSLWAGPAREDSIVLQRPVDRQGRLADYPECPVGVELEGQSFDRATIECWESQELVALRTIYVSAAELPTLRWIHLSLQLVVGGLILAVGAVVLRRRDLT